MSTHKQSLDPNQQANRWESAQSSSLATPDTARPTAQAQPTPSSNGPTPTPPETPEPHRGKSPFWWLKQRWQNSSFRTKLLLVLMVASALPAIASTQGSIIVAQRRALGDLEILLRRDLQLMDQELQQQENEHEAQARRIAVGVIASGIDPNNSGAAEAQLQNLLQSAVQDQPNRSFYIVTDAQGRTVAQYVQLLKTEIEPVLPSSNSMLEQEFEPVTLPTGISLADIPIVESALQGRPLAGFELIASEPLERLGLAEQANIGLRAFESQDPNESRRPSPEGTYDIDGGQAGLLVMAVEPIERQGTVIGTTIVGTLLNRNYEIVDRLKEEAEVATATIFAQDWRVSTNVPYSDGRTRAIGTRVSQEVAEQVLDRGEEFFGFANVVGVDYLTGYSPIYSHQQDLNPSQAQPIGIAYVGEPQTAVQATLRGITLTGYSIGGLAVLGASAAAVAVAGTFSQPLRRLSEFAERVGAGEKGIRLADTEREDEIGILSQEVQRMVMRLEAKAEQDQVMAAIARARQTQELEASLNNFLALVGSTLNADRVFLYRLDAGGGLVLAESVRPGWTSVLGQQLDHIWTPEGETDDQRSWTVPIPDVTQAGFGRDRLLMLQQLQVRSALSVSVLLNQELYGVLVVHDCAQTRDWQQSEIDYLAQGAQQLSVALSAYSLFEQQQAEAERQRQQKEALQQELLQLLSEIEGASQGNLTVRAEMSAGEIGVVADFFNVIIESLREIVMQVKQAAVQVNTSVGENEGAIRTLAEEAIAQAAQIDQTLDSVENMTRSIQEVADNARQAATVAQAASETAQSGGEAMDRVVQSILQLRETVAETAKKVKRLGESSQQISKVVSLINEIAMKTNLLAVNASIEAARAGEEGRGFAVVAEEVGELATQSTTATREIEQIVASIQRETSEVVRAMEVGTTQVVEGTQLVEETKQSLAQIVEVSQQIAQLVQSISNATVSQAQTSQSVAQLMEEIAQVSQRTSDSSRQVSSSLQATVQIAQQLQATVSTFTVEAEE